MTFRIRMMWPSGLRANFKTRCAKKDAARHMSVPRRTSRPSSTYRNSTRKTGAHSARAIRLGQSRLPGQEDHNPLLHMQAVFGLIEND